MRLARLFLLLVVLACVVKASCAERPLIDGGDGVNAILPLQVIGVREAARGELFWTDALGLGYPIRDELDFQQANPLGLLYLVLEPLRAFHVQIVIWVGLLALSAWACLRRVVPGFSDLECVLYVAFVLSAESFRRAFCYQVIFLSSFALLPLAWLAIRRLYERARLRDAALLALAVLLLVHSQYNFTLPFNFFMLGALALLEHARHAPRSRRSRAILAGLGVLLLGLAVPHLAAAIEIHRLSNRPETLVPHVSNLAENLGSLFGYPEWRAAGALLFAALALHARARRRGAAPLALHAPLILLSLGPCLVGLLLFDAPRHFARVSVIALLPAAIWAALVAGDLARRTATLLGPEARSRAALEAAGLVLLSGVLFLFATDAVGSHGPPPFDRLVEQRRALDALFGGERPEDLERFRVASVVEDDYRYEDDFLPRSLYQPSQAVLFGLHDATYYGSYLIDGARRRRTYEHIVTTQKFGTFGNVTAIARSGLAEPVFRLLAAKYLIAHERLDQAPLVLRGTVPPRASLGCPRQYLYELRRPLPRAWAVPLPPELASRLARAPLGEASDALEGFIEDALARGALDASLVEVRLARRGRRLALEGLGAVARPALVFVSMAYWPAWAPVADGVATAAPFGLTALVVTRAGDGVALEFRPATAPFEALGALLVLAAFGPLAWARRAPRPETA